MLFPVLDKDVQDEFYFNWHEAIPPEYMNISGESVENKTWIVTYWTRTYERQHNASGYYYTFFREKIGKTYSSY